MMCEMRVVMMTRIMMCHVSNRARTHGRATHRSGIRIMEYLVVVLVVVLPDDDYELESMQRIGEWSTKPGWLVDY